MTVVQPQFIKDTAGKKLVVLPQTQFEAIMEKLEELEDIKRYDKAVSGKLIFIDAKDAFKQIEAKRKKNVPTTNRKKSLKDSANN